MARKAGRRRRGGKVGGVALCYQECYCEKLSGGGYGVGRAGIAIYTDRYRGAVAVWHGGGEARAAVLTRERPAATPSSEDHARPLLPCNGMYDWPGIVHRSFWGLLGCLFFFLSYLENPSGRAT